MWVIRLDLWPVILACFALGCTGSGARGGDAGESGSGMGAQCGAYRVGEQCDCAETTGLVICTGGRPACDCVSGGGSGIGMLPGDGDGDQTGVVPVVDNCPVGSAGCPCTAGTTCDGALSCVSGYCVDQVGGDTCPVAAQGCACTQGGSCDGALSCMSGFCVVPPGAGDGDGDAVVAPVAGGAWAACAVDGDCVGGRMCTKESQDLVLTNGAPGQCVYSCQGNDTSMCDPPPPGGNQTICTADGTQTQMCVIACDQNDECPVGMECVTIPSFMFFSNVCALMP